ncbi:Putative Mn2+ efflux pump MntP [Prevotella sp. KH2C16]|nr:Putative Mn2+ efflux pump MntP [Prevotella sp. KH2C16]
MMSFLDILVLAVALAMDSFAMAIVSGVILKRREWGVIARLSFLFGFFQAAMPLLGWLLAARFARYIEAYDHWIAFTLLALIGGKMIVESFQEKVQRPFNPARLNTQMALALATSIDALAVGISFVCVGYSTLGSLLFPLLAIGISSIVLGVAGCLLGIHFGVTVSRRVKPELFGGVILVFIGIKILVSHLFGL